MKSKVFLLLLMSFVMNASGQNVDAWKLNAQNIDAKNYYGITVANGMLGVVSSPEPFKVKDVVLAGAFEPFL